MSIFGERIKRKDEIQSATAADYEPGTNWRWRDQSRGIAVNELGQLGTFPTHSPLPAPTKRRTSAGVKWVRQVEGMCVSDCSARSRSSTTQLRSWIHVATYEMTTSGVWAITEAAQFSADAYAKLGNVLGAIDGKKCEVTIVNCTTSKTVDVQVRRLHGLERKVFIKDEIRKLDTPDDVGDGNYLQIKSLDGGVKIISRAAMMKPPAVERIKMVGWYSEKQAANKSAQFGLDQHGFKRSGTGFYRTPTGGTAEVSLVVANESTPTYFDDFVCVGEVTEFIGHGG